ncbi:hypothetical protein SLT67_15900 [Paenibacillus illinoisensis]
MFYEAAQSRLPGDEMTCLRSISKRIPLQEKTVVNQKSETVDKDYLERRFMEATASDNNTFRSWTYVPWFAR